jgi:hypothetical protein
MGGSALRFFAREGMEKDSETQETGLARVGGFAYPRTL